MEQCCCAKKALSMSEVLSFTSGCAILLLEALIALPLIVAVVAMVAFAVVFVRELVRKMRGQ